VTVSRPTQKVTGASDGLLAPVTNARKHL
jgi:hypothetical protein